MVRVGTLASWAGCFDWYRGVHTRCGLSKLRASGSFFWPDYNGELRRLRYLMQNAQE
jgi:hypothetical protein